MAGLANDPGGKKRITFDHPQNRKRMTIRLGKMPEATAKRYRENIDHLIANFQTPELCAPTVMRWAHNLTDVIYSRIARTGLLPLRTPVQTQVVTLGRLVEEVKAELCRTKLLTQQNYACIFAMLLEHFDKDRALVGINRRDG